MIPGNDLLTALGLYLNISNHVIKEGGGPFEWCTAPMVNLGTYELKKLDAYKITPKESFMNAYVEEVFELEYICTPPKQ